MEAQALKAKIASDAKKAQESKAADAKAEEAKKVSQTKLI